ncbi:hypothetical protein COCNU_11G003150 [Cocos nucifera]|uniref:COMM domain-containing protein n=1 Tax=Cocos nucifera TaxID=13894 RepID=A0A8K0N952_COCNU|nr:hypothetical protein COCNU_11G003150 [Cocos nucifera]
MERHRLWGHLPLLVRSSSKESVEYILQALWRTRKTGLDAADRAIIRDMLHLPSDSDLDPKVVKYHVENDVDNGICLEHLLLLYSIFTFSESTTSTSKSIPSTTTLDAGSIRAGDINGLGAAVVALGDGELHGLALRKAPIALHLDQGLLNEEVLTTVIWHDKVEPQLSLLHYHAAVEAPDAAPSCVYENITKDEIQKLFPQEVLPELQRLLTLLLQKFQREWREDVLKDQVSLPRLKAMTWNMANQNQDSTEHVAIINLKLQGDTQSLSGETEVKFQLAKDTLATMLKSMYFIRDQLSNVGYGQWKKTLLFMKNSENLPKVSQGYGRSKLKLHRTACKQAKHKAGWTKIRFMLQYSKHVTSRLMPKTTGMSNISFGLNPQGGLKAEIDCLIFFMC